MNFAAATDGPSLSTILWLLQITVLPERIGGLVSVKIRIHDINDNTPHFTVPKKSIQLAEDQTQFQTMLEKATDRDSGANGQIRHSLTEVGAGTGDVFSMPACKSRRCVCRDLAPSP